MDILGLFAGFVTWQTPLSFLAGVGVHHLYCKYIRDREKPLYRTKKDGSYGFSSRFWTYTIIATIIIITLIHMQTTRLGRNPCVIAT